MATTPEEKTSTTRVERVHRNPRVMGLAALPFLICLLAIIGALVVNPAVLIGIVYGLAIGGAATAYAWFRNPWPRLKQQDVRVDAEWLHVGEERYARSEIKGGLIVPGKGHVTVRLERRGVRPALELRVATEELGRALLSQLGLAATQTVASFRAMSRMQTSMARQVGVMVAGLAATGGLTAGVGYLIGPGAVMGVLLVSIITLMTLMFAPSRVEVGADGVLMSWLGHKRFIEHGEIRTAHAEEVGFGNGRRSVVVLNLSSGERVVIPTGPPQFDGGRSRGLANRISTARDAFQRGESVHAEALLRRGERTHAEWVKALRTGEAHASHRSGTVPRERLWRIVEDVAIEPLDRAVAAVSLGDGLGEDERARLERTAGATAAPRLRIALDAVAQGEDEQSLAEALDELEAEAAKSARR